MNARHKAAVNDLLHILKYLGASYSRRNATFMLENVATNRYLDFIKYQHEDCEIHFKTEVMDRLLAMVN